MRLRFTAFARHRVGGCVRPAPGRRPAAPPRAHPHVNRAMTIAATPRTIIAGERVNHSPRPRGPVTRLISRHARHLWHRINPRRRFTIIGTTRTDADGRYEFTRAEGIVDSNRNWFVRGPAFTHSHTIHERVAAEVTLSPSATEGRTRAPLTFSGQISPRPRGQPRRAPGPARCRRRLDDDQDRSRPCGL